jgi:hypothetical protein
MTPMWIPGRLDQFPHANILAYVDDDNYIVGLTHALLIVSKVLKFFLLCLPLQYVSHSQGRPVFGGQSAGNFSNCCLIACLNLTWNFAMQLVREFRPGVLKFRSNLDFADHTSLLKKLVFWESHSEESPF